VAANAAWMRSCTKQGGNLGQITRGQVTPEFETMLMGLEPGQLCPVPVKTRYGVHIIYLHRHTPGRTLPFEMVRERIAEYLSEASWRRGVSQYIGLLIASAEIKGIDTEGASRRRSGKIVCRQGFLRHACPRRDRGSIGPLTGTANMG